MRYHNKYFTADDKGVFILPFFKVKGEGYEKRSLSASCQLFNSKHSPEIYFDG